MSVFNRNDVEQHKLQNLFDKLSDKLQNLEIQNLSTEFLWGPQVRGMQGMGRTIHPKSD